MSMTYHDSQAHPNCRVVSILLLQCTNLPQVSIFVGRVKNRLSHTQWRREIQHQNPLTPRPISPANRGVIKALINL
jgi:hypothetical protein